MEGKLGFHGKEKKLSKLEKAMKCRFVEEEKDPYLTDRGKAVIVHAGGNNYGGVYRGLNQSGMLVLLPSLQHTFTRVSEFDSERGRRVYYMQNERPEYIKHEATVAVSPTEIEHLEKMARGETLEKEREKLGEYDFSI